MKNEKDQTRYPDSKAAHVFGSALAFIVIGLLCIGLVVGGILTIWLAFGWLSIVWPIILTVCIVGLVLFVVKNSNDTTNG